MKYYETLFIEYIKKVKKINLHPEINFKKFPNNANELPNIIFYGPSGVGKYTQVLKLINKYSNLKYERKINIEYKKEYSFRISDIHFEIDMELLGCNAKSLWNIIFNNIIDIVSMRQSLTGIIVCKNFHKIHGELVDIFYSYMETLLSKNIKLVFFLITEELSFIPDNIISSSLIINVKKPSLTLYKKCFKVKNVDLKKVKNIKDIYSNINIDSYKKICNEIIHDIEFYKEIDFLKFRDKLYDIFIYHIDFHKCLLYILSYFIKKNFINDIKMNKIMKKCSDFLILYNNNYRPIYHLEKFMLYLCKVIHDF